MNLMFKITYGLYLLCAKDGEKDNACVINTFAQQTSAPETFSVTVNKQNLTTDMLKNSGKCAVAILSDKANFDLIKRFGMQSGKTADKFDGIESELTPAGVRVPKTNGVLGYFELEVVKTYDMGTHVMFVLAPTSNKAFVEDGEALTYAYYQSNVKPRPQVVGNKEKWVCKICGYVHEGPLPADFICPLCKHPASDFERVDAPQNTQSTEKWVCKICGYVHEGPLPADFICPLCKHPASDFEKVETTAKADDKIDDIKGEKTMAKYVCPICGYVHEGDNAPEKCPQCGCPGSKFTKDDGSKKVWAAEHVIGAGQGVPQDIYDGLKANFEGECTEVGMYLAMARAAHREGYPEIGLYWEKAAFEEAEHAAKFCELLGELISPSTKKNLEMRVDAENGATKGKFELAKRAKEEGLDAIHDTVHEMARDEARHGKAFEGLLNRYFK